MKDLKIPDTKPVLPIEGSIFKCETANGEELFCFIKGEWIKVKPVEVVIEPIKHRDKTIPNSKDPEYPDRSYFVWRNTIAEFSVTNKKFTFYKDNLYSVPWKDYPDDMQSFINWIIDHTNIVDGTTWTLYPNREVTYSQQHYDVEFY